MRNLENRIAIVTGDASGMGKATAKKMPEMAFFYCKNIKLIIVVDF